MQLSYCYCMLYKQNVVTKAAYFLKIDCHRILLSCVSMLFMMLLLVPPQKFAFLWCGIIDGRELFGRVKVIMSQHFSVLCEYAILMMLVSVPPQKFASICCGMIDRELFGRVKVATSQHFSVPCEYAINDVSVGLTSKVCMPCFWYYWWQGTELYKRVKVVSNSWFLTTLSVV
jgi:hypothetical protein